MIRSDNPHLVQKQMPKSKYKPKRTRAERRRENKLRRKINPRPSTPRTKPLTPEQQAANELVSLKYRTAARKQNTPQARSRYKRILRYNRRSKSVEAGKMRKCTRCFLTKAITDFDFQRDAKHPTTQRRYYCHLCRKKENADRYQARIRKAKQNAYADTDTDT